MNNHNQITLFAGAWRPQYHFEHIAWINPPWGNDDHIWLDFPEAIFTDQGLLYLSHYNEMFPMKFAKLPKVDWGKSDSGIYYSRTLPNGVSWDGSVTSTVPNVVNLSLQLKNYSTESLTTIRLQTCLFMRAHYALSPYSLKNKYIFLDGKGWVDLEAARAIKKANGRYRFGWRSGPKIATLPVIACQAASGDHAVAFSWLRDTYSLTSNPDHPCIHADPSVPDLASGASYELRGEIFFAEHGLKEIEGRYSKKEK